MDWQRPMFNIKQAQPKKLGLHCQGKMGVERTREGLPWWERPYCDRDRALSMGYAHSLWGWGDSFHRGQEQSWRIERKKGTTQRSRSLSFGHGLCLCGLVEGWWLLRLRPGPWATVEQTHSRTKCGLLPSVRQCLGQQQGSGPALGWQWTFPNTLGLMALCHEPISRPWKSGSRGVP